MTFAVASALVLIVNIPVIQDADAKGFSSSRSFSSKSFSRSSYRSSGSSSKSSGSSKSMFKSYKSTSKPVAAKPAPKTTSSKFGKSGKTATYSTVSSGSSTKAAKKSLTAQRAKFTKPAPKVTTASSSAYKSKYKSHGAYASARSANPATYHTRRNSYYAGYSTPSYVYGMSPSYGLWDTIFLYSMLSSMNNNRHAGQFAHNYSNDADYNSWRREADVLARDNAELRGQLATLDGQTANFSGQTIDPNYMPQGVDADIAMSAQAMASIKPTLRVCVGSQTGAYFRVTAGILAPGSNTVNMVAVTTSGTGEILDKLADGSCDAGFVQGDGYWNYVETKQTADLPFVRVFSPFKEEVHLVCNESGPKHIGKLTSANTVLFPKNSGAAQTWLNFTQEDDSYGDVKTVLNTPTLDVSSYESAMLAVANDENTCAMYVGAEGGTTLMKNIDTGAKATKSVLIAIEDGDLNDTTDPSGKAVYAFSDMSSYKNLLRKGGCYGYCSGSIQSLSMNADFLVGTQWKNANKTTYDQLAVELLGMSSEISKAVKQ